MLSLDFRCEVHGYFEEMFLENYTASHPCPSCGMESEQVWLKAPNVDSFAASAWSGIHDPNFGNQVFTDRARYYQAIEASGRFINEPGVSKDAQENEKRYLAGEEKKLCDKIDLFVQDRTIDELRAGLKVDAAIHEATVRHDANAIKRMGGLTSVNEAYNTVKDGGVKVRTKHARTDAA